MLKGEWMNEPPRGMRDTTCNSCGTCGVSCPPIHFSQGTLWHCSTPSAIHTQCLPWSTRGGPPPRIKAEKMGQSSAFHLCPPLVCVSSDLIQPCDFHCHPYLGTLVCLALFPPPVSGLRCVFNSLYRVSARMPVRHLKLP